MKIQSNISKENWNLLKEEMKNKQIQFFYSKMDDENYKKLVKENVANIVRNAFEKPISFYIKNTNEIREGVNKALSLDNIQNILVKYGKMFVEFIKEYVKNYDVTVKDLLTEELLKKIEHTIEQPFNLDKKQVKEILDQEAVKELFITIIYKAIEKVTKSIPFTGVFGGAKTFENKIKDSISGGMDFTIDVATDFITDEKNEKQIRKFLKKMINSILSLNLKIILSKIDLRRISEEESTLKNLFDHVIKVPMIKDAVDYTVEHAYNKEKNKSAKELINDDVTCDSLIEMVSENITLLIFEYIKTDAFKSFIEKDISEFYDSLEV